MRGGLPGRAGYLRELEEEVLLSSFPREMDFHLWILVLVLRLCWTRTTLCGPALFHTFQSFQIAAREPVSLNDTPTRMGFCDTIFRSQNVLTIYAVCGALALGLDIRFTVSGFSIASARETTRSEKRSASGTTPILTQTAHHNGAPSTSACKGPGLSTSLG